MGKMTKEIRKKIAREQARMDRRDGEFNINDKRKIITRVITKYKIKKFFSGIFKR